LCIKVLSDLSVWGKNFLVPQSQTDLWNLGN
jgi:hypothetical protein